MDMLGGVGGALVYYLIGMLVADGSIVVWKSGKRTVWSFLFFPMSHVTSREKLNDHERAKPPIASNPKDPFNPIETHYEVLVILWPIKVFSNLTSIAILVPTFLILQYLAERLGYHVGSHVVQLPRNDWDRYDRLNAERERLSEQRAELDNEITDLEKKLEGSGPKSVYRLRGKKTG